MKCKGLPFLFLLAKRRRVTGTEGNSLLSLPAPISTSIWAEYAGGIQERLGLRCYLVESRLLWGHRKWEKEKFKQISGWLMRSLTGPEPASLLRATCSALRKLGEMFVSQRTIWSFSKESLFPVLLGFFFSERELFPFLILSPLF